MMQTLLVTPVLILAGACIWIRRQSWRFSWDRVQTLGVFLQALGFTLSLPITGHTLGKWLFHLTGISHIRDYTGHLCFLSAAGAIIYSVAKRLLPDQKLEPFMKRIEYPSAIAAIAMLGCVLASHSLRHFPVEPDFLQVPRDNWLTAYWLIYMATCAYLIRYLVDLLFMLREDPRNHFVASLYIAACRIGFIAILLVVVDVVSTGRNIATGWILTPLAAASGLAIFASAWSWHKRKSDCPHP
jgi:hypothetical protein